METHGATHVWDGSEPINLSASEDKVIRARIRGSRWNQKNPTQGPTIRVTLAPRVRELYLTIGPHETARILLAGAGGGLAIKATGASTRLSHLEVASERVLRLELERLDFVLSHPESTRLKGIEDIYATESKVALKGVSLTRLRPDKSTLNLDSVELGELAIPKGSRIGITMSKSSITRLVSYGPGADDSPVIVKPDSNFSVKSCSDVSVILGKNSKLTVTGFAEGVSAGGQGILNLANGGDRIHVKQPVVISVGPHARLAQASGSAVFGNVSHASISSDTGTDASQQLEIVGFLSDTGLEGVLLSGVLFPTTSKGIRTMRALSSHALTVTPGIHRHLPGLRSKDRHPFARWRQPRAELNEANLYAATLAQLARDREASSNARTRLDWAAYRMRNVAADSWLERSLLSWYRLIGYGERFLPPLTTYAACAALATAVSLSNQQFAPDAEGVRAFLAAWATWLVSPFEILSVDPDVSLPGDLWAPLRTILQVAIAIPFVTAVLALRKYARGRGDLT